MQNWHRLLKRQLKNLYGEPSAIPPQWQAFLDAVNTAYEQFDSDRTMVERSLELTSQELLLANAELRRANEDLERRVRERTAELMQANESLQAEVVERKRAEVELAHEEETLRRMAEWQSTLFDVLHTVSEELDPAAVTRLAVVAIARFTNWPNVSLVLPADDGQNWTVRAAAGNLEQLLGMSYPLGNGVVGRTIATGQTQNVPDVTIDPNYIGSDSTLRSELAVPLRRGGRILGVLNIESDQWAAFDADGVQLAESLADAVALALDNAGLYQTIADERSQLDALIRSSRDGVILVGTEQRTLVINTPALDMLRLPGASEQWIGRPITEVLRAIRHTAPAVVRSVTAEIRRIVRGNESPGEGEYEVGSRSVHWFSLPVMAGASPVGRLLVLRDVTEERLLEKMREDLTHTMVHDLRNPLTVILSALETLGDDIGGTLEEEQRQMLTIASNSAEQMLNLVKAILDVNQLESGRMPLERGRLALEALVAETLELEALLVGDKKQRLVNRVSVGLPDIFADPKLIGRVLQNLVGNAIKFTPANGVITVTAGVAPFAPQMIEVAVGDTGPGIPPELRSKLFQKFVSGKHQRGNGSGLGLAFCRLAVEAHGGRIWAESEPGRGATFRFTLPLADA